MIRMSLIMRGPLDIKGKPVLFEGLLTTTSVYMRQILPEAVAAQLQIAFPVVQYLYVFRPIIIFFPGHSIKSLHHHHQQCQLVPAAMVLVL